MRQRAMVLLVCVAALLGCGRGDGEKVKELDLAQAQWEQQALESYTFEYVRSCFCGLAGQTLLVTVDGGVVSEVKKKADGAVLQVGDYGSVPTIAGLFEKLERASREAEVWSATYDPERGYPRSVTIDWRKAVADDEATETISEVTTR